MCDLAKHPSYARCAVCGQCFASDSAFDRHLGRVPARGRPKCKRPEDVRNGARRLTYDQERAAWRWDDSGDHKRSAALHRGDTKARSAPRRSRRRNQAA